MKDFYCASKLLRLNEPRCKLSTSLVENKTMKAITYALETNVFVPFFTQSEISYNNNRVYSKKQVYIVTVTYKPFFHTDNYTAK